MQINASQLVRLISTELRVSESASPGQTLAMGWAAWKFARANPTQYGNRSFALIGLEIIFRALDKLKEV